MSLLASSCQNEFIKNVQKEFVKKPSRSVIVDVPSPKPQNISSYYLKPVLIVAIEDQYGALLGPGFFENSAICPNPTCKKKGKLKREGFNNHFRPGPLFRCYAP